MNDKDNCRKGDDLTVMEDMFAPKNAGVPLAKAFTESQMKLENIQLFHEIDPYLQKFIDLRQRGYSSPITSSTNKGEVSVCAKVTDINEWHNISEVYPGATIAKLQDGNILVTGRIPIDRIEAVRQYNCVNSLKPAKRLRPMLNYTVEETGATQTNLPNDMLSNLGEGVIVGIVDFGCDFQHENFRNNDGSTRIKKIWDQSAGQNQHSPHGYGKLYNSDDINRALQSDNPYDELGYGGDWAWNDGTHGTHVMDICAGNGNGTDHRGMAPNSEIVFVHPSSSDVNWVGEQVVGSEFGDSVQLLEAIRFIFDAAGDTPCVVNLSLGTNGGAHDGLSVVEMGIDAMLQEKPNRAVVIAASNSYADGIHAEGDVAQNDISDISWLVESNDTTHNELEIWYRNEDEFKLELIAPNNQSLGTVILGSSARLKDNDGNTLIFISHRKKDPNNNDNTIGIYFEKGLPAGEWTLRLHGVNVNNGHYHTWIERDDRGQSQFSEPLDNTHTLGSISTGEFSIVVGSYDAHKSNTPLSYFSSAGPTRDNKEKPEVSAPGHNVWAAKSGSKTNARRMSGTSMAAPAVTGLIALMLAEAHKQNKDLSIAQIREILISTARGSGNGAWHDRYGYGRIDAEKAIQLVIET